MRLQYGETRSSIRDRHALIAPDSHETTTLPNWRECSVVVVISPHMGAKFSQYFVSMTRDMVGASPLESVERFIFLLEGSVTLKSGDDNSHVLMPEGYALIPAGMTHEIVAIETSRLMVLERTYVPLAGQPYPPLIVNNVAEISKAPLKGDDRLMLQKLIPDDLGFDCEVNVMDFEPGASLSYVETHFMEHGLLMLNGGGVYRLDEQWYSVEAGDIIWMGPYCAQWFGAIGKINARYLIYKNWNRDPLIV